MKVSTATMHSLARNMVTSPSDKNKAENQVQKNIPSLNMGKVRKEQDK
jgi:hypothetical protein